MLEFEFHYLIIVIVYGRRYDFIISYDRILLGVRRD